MTPNIPPALVTEVVGGVSGRLGSQFLRLVDTAVAVPRGVCPGSVSEAESPIFVCTSASSWCHVVATTLPERRNDLVFVGNGLWDSQSVRLQDCTIVIPHYAILRVGDKPVISSRAPATYIAGKHAALVQTLLQHDGIPTEILHRDDDIASKATLKLLWASCLWLLCHAPASIDEPISTIPLSVSHVHAQRAEVLHALVQELWPSVMDTIQTQSMNAKRTTTNLPSLDDAMLYLQQYSASIPHAVPSLRLALSELSDRNGVFARPNQELHQQLIQQVAGETALSIFNAQAKLNEKQTVASTGWRLVDVRSSIGMSFYGRRHELDIELDPDCPRKVLIVGAGMLGCSVALNLARMRGDIQITVVDCGANMDDTKPTTRASWGWLNANQKQPAHYQHFSALGMHAWRCDALLRDLPTWNGSLVRYANALDAAWIATSGFYSRATGPLSRLEWLALEPNANFVATIEGDEHPVYLFPNEGLVDPCDAVIALRRAAAHMGVTFLWNHCVTEVACDHDTTSTVTLHRGKMSSQDTTISPSLTTLDANFVVVAAGTGTSAFATVPLLHRPGRIAFFKPLPTLPRLKRVLVDVVAKSHVLQRHDGMLVVGGGPLEVGGTSTTAEPTALFHDLKNESFGSRVPKGGADDMGTPLLTSLLNESTLIETAEAVRPMPADGLPVIGLVRPGLYSVVAHSGVTLGPLLGSLAAAEIIHGVELDVLHPFRPQRFQSTGSQYHLVPST